MAFVSVPTAAPDSMRRLPAVTLTVCAAALASASLMEPATSKLMLRLSLAPPELALSWPSTRSVAAWTRIAPLLVEMAAVAPIVTAPLAAWTSTVCPSASVASLTPPVVLPMSMAPLASTDRLPELELTSASMSMSPASVCSRTLPLPAPVAAELIAPETVSLPLLSTRETCPEAALMPAALMPSSAGGKVLIARSLSSRMKMPPLAVLVAPSVATRVRSAAPEAPMPLAACSDRSLASPIRFGASPLRLSMIAPLLLLRTALAPKLSLLRRTSPPACRLTRPPLPSDSMPVPSAIVIAPPACRATRPPVEPAAPETMWPPRPIAPAVAVSAMLLALALAVRLTPAAVVMSLAAVRASAPRLAMFWLTIRFLPLPCASSCTAPLPALSMPLVEAPLSASAAALLTRPDSTVTLPPLAVSSMVPLPPAQVCARLTMPTSPLICAELKRPSGALVRAPLTVTLMSPWFVLTAEIKVVSTEPRLMPVAAWTFRSRLRSTSPVFPSLALSACAMLPCAEYNSIESASISLKKSLPCRFSSGMVFYLCLVDGNRQVRQG